MEIDVSNSLFDQAKQVIAGGVNSPVRAFKSVGGDPVFFKRGAGARLYDTGGKAYIDYVGSWGPLILGHAHPAVVAAVKEAVDRGLSFGAPTEVETRLANRILEWMPSVEKIRFVNSGTEAAMSAIRLARGFTGRDNIVKFEGCYHGHVDSLLVRTGSGALTLGVPTSPGVPGDLARHTLTATYNDPASVTAAFDAMGPEIAAVIVEPVAGNMNCIPPVPGFLDSLREACTRAGALLIIDEVMTGFRVARGGAQALYGIHPDLTILGKVIGGGMPVGAFGGRADVMAHLAPDGPVYQAGTLSGNPITMTAGLATLNELSRPGFFEELSGKTEKLTSGLRRTAADAGIALTTNHMGGMFGFFFSSEPAISRFSQVMECNRDHFKKFFHGMLDRGIYLAPSPFEAGFMSMAHGDEEIEATLAAARTVFGEIEKESAARAL